MARDKLHYNARRALEKDGWTITHDPLRIQAGEVKGEIDLGAETLWFLTTSMIQLYNG